MRWSGADPPLQVISMLTQGWRMPQHKKVPNYFYEVQLDCFQLDRLHRPGFKFVPSAAWLSPFSAKRAC